MHPLPFFCIFRNGFRFRTFQSDSFYILIISSVVKIGFEGVTESIIYLNWFKVLQTRKFRIYFSCCGASFLNVFIYCNCKDSVFHILNYFHTECFSFRPLRSNRRLLPSQYIFVSSQRPSPHSDMRLTKGFSEATHPPGWVRTPPLPSFNFPVHITPPPLADSPRYCWDLKKLLQKHCCLCLSIQTTTTPRPHPLGAIRIILFVGLPITTFNENFFLQRL